ncbi:MAG: cupredoxin domain-containing protein [Betaproteobacteria bacterium]|nr:cupredoxin domain-containing protein [Betaproteobacteria bacterium]
MTFPTTTLRRAAILALALLLPSVVAAETVEVKIADYKFVPDKLVVKPGTTVKWVNGGKRTSHSIHFEKEGLAESERLFPGESWQRSFDKPGTYPYTCGPHPEMQAVIEVVP